VLWAPGARAGRPPPRPKVHDHNERRAAASWRFPESQSPIRQGGALFFREADPLDRFPHTQAPTTLRALRKGAVAALLKTARKYLPREKANLDQRYSIVAQILGNVKKC